jgi:hypothetical protein
MTTRIEDPDTRPDSDDRRSGAATATPEAPAVQDGQEARRISHWIGGRATPGR